MSFQIVAMTATQVPPIAADSATVRVAFQVAGGAPDVIEVYAHDLAGGDVGGRQDLRKTVAFVAGTVSYDVTVGLRAGAAFTISVCPRSVTGGVLDDTIDGQPWESDCAIASLFTRAPTSPPGATWPPPTIIGLDPEPATLTGDGTITVSWQSSVPYDKFLIWWTESGVANAQGEVGSRGTSGSWAAPTRPGLHYTFAVKGGVSSFWDYKYSDWGPTVSAVGAANLRSLRAFLQHSGRPGPQSVRGLMPPGNGSLRALMRL